jgi:tetratricopeptide (TPR) repeat protein
MFSNKGKFIALVGFVMLMVLKSTVAQDLNAAINLMYQQQFEQADNAFNDLLKADPGNAKYYYYSGENQLASYFVDTSNISFKSVASKAQDRYNKGISVNSDEPLNYVGLGKVALIKGDKATAEADFAKAQGYLPVKKSKNAMTKQDQAILLIRIAEAYVKVGSRDTATVFGLFRRAEQLDSRNPDLWLIEGDYWINTMNNGGQAAQNYRLSQDLMPQSTRARLKLGQLYTRIKIYSDALDYYQEAVNIDPSFAPAYLEMGFLYAKTNNEEESKKYFRKYLDLSKSNIAAKRNYANMLIQAEEYPEAIEQINQILAMDSVSFNDLNRALAYSYFEEKKYQKAYFYIKKFFNNAAPEKTTSKDYLYLGRILIKNDQDSLGIANLETAFNLDTTNLDLLNEIALAYLKIKKPADAAKTYQEKINRSNGSLNDYYRMARAYFDAKMWGEADSALAVVNRLSPDFEPAYLFRARVYSTLDPETTEGLAKPFYDFVVEKALTDSVKYSKDLLEAYSYLGYYYLVNRQYCESLMYWDKILGIDPANENASSALKDLKSRCPEFKPVYQQQ